MFPAASVLFSSEAPVAAEWLLDGFREGDIFFASPSTQWRARAHDGMLAAYCPVSRAAVQSLFDQAHQRDAQNPVLFGLIPFDARRPASLSMPLRIEPAHTPDVCAVPDAASPVITHSDPVPPPEVYGDAVRQALALMQQGQLNKIVLARAMDVTLDRPLDFVRLLYKLLSGNRHGYTFALPMWRAQDLRTPSGMMMGASPELLVRRVGDAIHVNPLAGSIGRHPDPDADTRLREGLSVSEKDLREHTYVVADIARILREHCDDLQIPDQPSVIGTDTLWHLSTVITGRLRNPAMTALDLSCALHPTPAICGAPTDTAFQHLATLEPFDREYFAGLVGWQRPDGDGEWALTLRCARVTQQNCLRLYAGAGIVAGSSPDHEIVETATKMETFLRALR